MTESSTAKLILGRRVFIDKGQLNKYIQGKYVLIGQIT